MRNLKWKHILIGLCIILTDLFVYLVIGTLMMGYDDTYNESKGEYWSLASMTTNEQVIYLGMQVWNVLNLFAIVYIIYRLTRKNKKRAITAPTRKSGFGTSLKGK